MSALLEVRGLVKEYRLPAGPFAAARRLRAVAGVDLEVARGECLALVGESGCGKTTLARCALRLDEPTAGRVRFAGRDLTALGRRDLRRWRRHFQMIFQDPYGSLNPRLSVGRAIAEPLVVHRLGDRAERRRRVAELLDLVGLPADAERRLPHEFSGGQRQRIGIARALASGPELVIADEPVSALDVSVRAQIVNLLAELQRRFALALVFIAHDLPLVEHVADRVAVMYLGRIVELAPRDALFARPQHPYTAGLLAAAPSPDPRRRGRRAPPVGEQADPAAAAAGCAYAPRCPIARPRCREEAPPLEAATADSAVACFYPGEMEQIPP